MTIGIYKWWVYITNNSSNPTLFELKNIFLPTKEYAALIADKKPFAE